jgi:hypothetical protein
MLKSAIINPNVFLVFGTNMALQQAKSKFVNMINELEKESIRTRGMALRSSYNDWPKFITIDRVEDSIRGNNHFIPLVFDNSCYYT